MCRAIGLHRASDNRSDADVTFTHLRPSAGDVWAADHACNFSFNQQSLASRMADSAARPRRSGANKSNAARERIEAAKRRRQNGTLVAEEAPVYDTLNDDEYAQLVAKRRQAGAF